ncbi:hypothetical protein [Streptomyces sp. NPDC001389]|uniref:hypothetical protein n=1 Tax=unclassified Streptomyces TaxID=2593676 RepID=UPI0036B3940C
MIHTRFAQATAVATVSLMAILLAPVAATAVEAKTPASATAEIPGSLGWGVRPASDSLGWG